MGGKKNEQSIKFARVTTTNLLVSVTSVDADLGVTKVGERRSTVLIYPGDRSGLTTGHAD
jgi:hypothetical protein